MPYADLTKQRAYQAAWIARQRAEWLAANGPCVWCGSDEQLEVDHLDPSIKVTHRVWSWKAARRDAELAHCRVLCRSCHKKRTSEQRKRPLIHGRPTTYNKHGCRCELCKRANYHYRRGGWPALNAYYGTIGRQDLAA